MEESCMFYKPQSVSILPKISTTNWQRYLIIKYVKCNAKSRYAKLKNPHQINKTKNNKKQESIRKQKKKKKTKTGLGNLENNIRTQCYDITKEDNFLHYELPKKLI